MKMPLFDIDGTLLNSNVAHRNSYDYAFRNVYKVDASREEITCKGKIDNQILIEVLMRHNFKPDEIKKKLGEAHTAMFKYFTEHENEGNYTPLPGVVEILKELKLKHALIGVLTGNVEGIGWRKLENAGIKKFFNFGAFGNIGEKRSELVPAALKRAKKINIGASLNDLIIIGDTFLDILCAKENNIQSIGVATGEFSVEQLIKAGADLAVKSLVEKEKILEFLKA